MPASYDPSITLDWADGTYTFRLCGVAEWTKLEDACGGLSLFEVAERIFARRARAAWISEAIRLALIGGGLNASKALRLVREYVDQAPGGLADSIPIAAQILSVACAGKVPDAAQDPQSNAEPKPIDAGALYGAGAAMGFTPQQVDAMSVYQFVAAANGYKRAHGGNTTGGKKLSVDDYRELEAKYG